MEQILKSKLPLKSILTDEDHFNVLHLNSINILLRCLKGKA